METEVKDFLKILHELQKLDPEFPLHYAICLAEISLNEGMSLTDLSNNTGLSISTISRIIGALSNSRQRGQAYELVEVRTSETEKRKKELYLSPKGRNTLNSISGIIAA
ncbi:MAG: winged helix-turn-helix transcriptional regulator [Micavibrio sp.]|nr:winged helix-turn-helix transcriptional regulator [Micavibrio sp.]